MPGIKELGTVNERILIGVTGNADFLGLEERHLTCESNVKSHGYAIVLWSKSGI